MEEFKKYDIVLILGNYGSGKSQVAREYFHERKRINRHEIRHHLKEMTQHGADWNADDWDEELEGLIKHVEYDVIVHFLERNEKIIIDNTSLTVRSRKRYIDYARKFHKSIACIFLNKDTSVLLAQNRSREFPVPEHLIVKLYAKTEIPAIDEGFAQVLIM
jgi:predicted kinase